MKKYIYKHLLFVALLGFFSCETTELDLLSNPNDITQDNLDPNFLFNSIQLSYAGFIESASNPAEALMRQANFGGPTYQSGYAPISFNGLWSSAYVGVLNDIKALEPIAEENQLTYHQGVAKIMKAHIYMTLVDLFGDVPYSEALLGNENLNPSADSGADVYTAALAELDAGIALMQQEPSNYPPNDGYYGGGSVDAASAAKWVTAAKSLKLRALLTVRLNGSAIDVDVVAGINSLISANDLIDTPEEDFVIQYGNNRANPNTRHPDYNNAYESGGGRYMANFMMWQLSNEKGFDDPRLSYYFYRQDLDTSDETAFTLNCATQPRPAHYNSFNSIYEPSIKIPFCTADGSRGYWGRDFGDGSGIPPDNTKRTQVGLYPAGGKYDNGEGGSVQNSGVDGELGAGITPIILSSFVNFMKAEAALTLGTSGDARTLLKTGIEEHMEKVTTFLEVEGNATDEDITNYVDYVMAAYDAADNNGKLNILMKEWHIASFGNGLDAYNNYRRTGFPNNLQPMLDPNQGDFYYTLLYPNSFLESNASSVDKPRTVRTFWDTNSFNLN